jgi:hypothetical protein
MQFLPMPPGLPGFPGGGGGGLPGFPGGDSGSSSESGFFGGLNNFFTMGNVILGLIVFFVVWKIVKS